MATKGQLKPPVLPLIAAHRKAMELIDRDKVCALFIRGGVLTSTKKSSSAFEVTIARRAGSLVGVYDDGADCRWVLEDLKEFYRGRDAR
jgi:hypothetical protein